MGSPRGGWPIVGARQQDFQEVVIGESTTRLTVQLVTTSSSPSGSASITGHPDIWAQRRCRLAQA